MENKYKTIVQNGIADVSRILLGDNMIEKEELLNFIFSCLDPYFLGYIEDLSFHDEVFTLCEKIIVGNNSKECKEEALFLLHTYSVGGSHEILKQNLDKIESEFLPDADYLSRRHFTINGKNFNDIDGFYDEVEKVFTKGLSWKIGRNLDAFADVLRGGFGMHELGEPIVIFWANYRKSKRDLGKTLINDIVEIIKDNDNSGHDCILET